MQELPLFPQLPQAMVSLLHTISASFCFSAAFASSSFIVINYISKNNACASCYLSVRDCWCTACILREVWALHLPLPFSYCSHCLKVSSKQELIWYAKICIHCLKVVPLCRGREVDKGYFSFSRNTRPSSRWPKRSLFKASWPHGYKWLIPGQGR